MSGNFAVALKNFAEKAGANADAVVRKVVIDIGTRLVERSPVGDPDLWSSKAPKGYIGGRFRANWQYGNFNGAGIPIAPLDAIDPSGQVSIDRITAGVPVKGAAGMRHLITNNLPYAQALESGWSTQAPSGMVGITAIEFQAIVNAAVQNPGSLQLDPATFRSNR